MNSIHLAYSSHCHFHSIVKILFYFKTSLCARKLPLSHVYKKYKNTKDFLINVKDTEKPGIMTDTEVKSTSVIA